MPRVASCLLKSPSILLLLRVLVAKEHLPELLANVAKLILILPSKAGDHLLRDVAELVVSGRLLSSERRQALGGLALQPARNVAELV